MTPDLKISMWNFSVRWKNLIKGFTSKHSLICLFLRLLSRNREGGECSSCIGSVTWYTLLRWVVVYKCPVYDFVADWMFVSPAPNWPTEILTECMASGGGTFRGDKSEAPHAMDECPTRRQTRGLAFSAHLKWVIRRWQPTSKRSRASPAPCGLSPWSRASCAL